MSMFDRYVPPAPRTIMDCGLAPEVVFEILSKTLHLTGSQTGRQLAARLGVPFTVIEPCIDNLKRQRHVEISGGAMTPQSYTYRMTDAGHARAAEFTELSQYVGPLPVPIDQYRAYMGLFQQWSTPQVTRRSMRKAFQNLVLSDRMLDQLGPAVAAQHSLFLYGPPGNGKTRIAQTIGALFPGAMAIPHAIAVERDIIRIFDPINHTPIQDDAEGADASTGLVPDTLPDGRWVLCARPVVTVGGELTLDSLELGLLPGGYYRAPLQTLANGGILVLDDFGRQRARPAEILNRWIVPLESRIDHLMLQSGQKFEMPFQALVVFATNLNPLDLLDESFLRRIRYKVYAESPSRKDFIEIFARCCEERGLQFDRRLVEDLIATELEPHNIELRGCQPRDLIEHALSLAAYIERPNELSPELLSAACATYFLGDNALVDR